VVIVIDHESANVSERQICGLDVDATLVRPLGLMPTLMTWLMLDVKPKPLAERKAVWST
jgi:hypothetical protein